MRNDEEDRSRRLAERIAEQRRVRARQGAPQVEDGAIQAFLSRLTGGSGPAEAAAPPAAVREELPGAVLPFQRPASAVLVVGPDSPLRAAAPQTVAPQDAIPQAAAAREAPVPEEARREPPDPARDLAELAATLEAASDLDRLPGAGPGLIWLLRRAGIRRLADLAALEPADLADRLGPVGRLVPLQRWIGVGRAAEAGAGA